ncbi:MAG TPA: acetyl-CoA C-acetyltransferase [Burkholderiales bacterium]|nr:acetyl-CoA C-acetyltransferase [Burkholderiales bacterium]
MMSKAIYIIDGARTPFLKSRNRPGPFSASDLATAAGKSLLARQAFAPDELDEVILGCAAPSVDEVNIGRVAALRMGCGQKVPGWTVMRNCASGMQALDSAIANMLSGRSSLVLAGGVDALSRVPLLYSDLMVMWFSGLMAAKSPLQKAGMFLKLKPAQLLAPVIGLVKGLTDPYVGLLMGQTAENLAYRFGIGRREMDEFAARSHERVIRAQENRFFSDAHDGLAPEISPIYDDKGDLFGDDDGVRKDSTAESLAKLKPVFDRKYGNVTAGNSSRITDGAAWLVLATDEAVKRHKLEPRGRIVDSQWAGLDPAQMGLGPVHAATPILKRHGLAIDDLDAWEINEAFAAQVLGCLAAWKDEQYCRDELGLDHAAGELDPDKLNVDGGAIAIGHPVGASGARIVLHLLHALKSLKGKRGIAAICIGGGLGGAMLVEAL